MPNLSERRKKLVKASSTWVALLFWVVVITVLVRLGRALHQLQSPNQPLLSNYPVTNWMTELNWHMLVDPTNRTDDGLRTLEIGFAPDGTVRWRVKEQSTNQ